MVSCGAMVSSSQLRVCVCCGQCTQTGPVTQFDLEGNRQLFAIESVRLVCKSGAGTSILFRTMVSQHDDCLSESVADQVCPELIFITVTKLVLGMRKDVHKCLADCGAATAMLSCALGIVITFWG